jgi:hypothetical protein
MKQSARDTEARRGALSGAIARGQEFPMDTTFPDTPAVSKPWRLNPYDTIAAGLVPPVFARTCQCW